MKLVLAICILVTAWLLSSKTRQPSMQKAGRHGGGDHFARRRLSIDTSRASSLFGSILGSLGLSRHSGTGGGARWASWRDVHALIVRRAGSGRLVLGRFGRHLLAAENGSSVLVVGPTQSRKTSGFAVPAVLEWDGPVLAASVKSDLARDTLSWRRTLGKVWVYDPSGVTGIGDSIWSPLAGATTWSGARRMAASMTEVARSSAGNLTEGDFWYATAAKLLAPLFMAATVSGRTMTDVVRWLDEQETFEVTQALESAGEAGRLALQAALATWGRDERQRSAVYTTAETVVECFSDPLVTACASRSATGRPAGHQGVGRPSRSSGTGGSIDPVELLEGSNTLYLCAPARDQRRLRPLFATLVSQVVEAAFERAQRQGRPLDGRLLVVLDEAANVAPVADLDVLASTAAGHGVQLVTVWQDLGQLNARYGARAGSVVNNHRAKVFLSGISDPHTLEHASQLVGDAEHETFARTFDGTKAPSTTRSPVVRRLLPADALRRVPPGRAVLVSGHLPPVLLSLRPWQEDSGLRARATVGRSRPGG